jgi:hypothetical protein
MAYVQHYVTKDEELRTAVLREIEWRPDYSIEGYQGQMIESSGKSADFSSLF